MGLPSPNNEAATPRRWLQPQPGLLRSDCLKTPVFLVTTTTLASVPHALSKPMAWSAFDYIFSSTDWRLRIQSLRPISLKVEYDDAFASCLSESGDWRTKHHALSWIANRVLQLAQGFDKTHLRRLSLQLPETDEGPIAEALLSNVERRIRDTVLDELVTHFDCSIPEWERELQREVASIDDAHVRWLVSRHAGLDQVVSVDAARKAIRFVFSRTHWHLTEVNGRTVLNPDWRFEQVRALRTSLDERTRARSLVARCIETLIQEHVREQRASVEVAPMTRLRLKADVERRFAEKGCRGLIDLCLTRDRSLYNLRAPGGLGESLKGLLDKQEERLEGK